MKGPTKGGGRGEIKAGGGGNRKAQLGERGKRRNSEAKTEQKTKCLSWVLGGQGEFYFLFFAWRHYTGSTPSVSS